MSAKIFIIGLPRTGTTSLCVTLLDCGYSVAHTAYVQRAFEQAEVIADTPVFCDFPALSRYYPQSRFIYLSRTFEQWLPSIRQLLLRMLANLQTHQGGFNPTIKRCYFSIFSDLSLQNIMCDDYLLACYQKHQQAVNQCFSQVPERLLQIDVSDSQSLNRCLAFIGAKPGINPPDKMAHINKGGKVTAWNAVNHPLKVSATQAGRVEKVDFYFQ